MYLKHLCTAITVILFGACVYVGACVGDASKWPTHNTRDVSVSADKLCDG